MTGALQAQFDAALGALCPRGLSRLGLAVSGGSDSVALMRLAHMWVDRLDLQVVTLDHGLRPEAAFEAEQVARQAKSLGMTAKVLRWNGWDGRGNLQDAARRARQRLIADWARSAGIEAVALGHTLDDQAETLVMRLARGSGVDGLGAMAPARQAKGVLWLRPLLDMRRADLRAWLSAQGIGWIEDPSNFDQGFTRTRAREALTQLAQLGLTPERLARTAHQMRAARDVLDAAAQQAARAIMQRAHGDLVFDAEGLDALPEDTRARLVAQALCEIASNRYRPRLAALTRALTAPRAALHGCLLIRHKGQLRITREPRVVRDLRVGLHDVWDQRWRIEPRNPEMVGDDTRELQIGALGEDGLAACPDRALWQVPRCSLPASPALWHGTRLIAAPLAGFAPQWRAKLVNPAELSVLQG